MSPRDAGLQFWLRYVESAGGLAESGTESATAILPSGLQQDLDLPDSVTVTADPDVAREEGAVLLAAGHPALTRAAEAVLEGGDAGVVALPRPASVPPQRDELQAKARKEFPVQHGRIDATDAPRPGLRPVLHVGALVSYTMSEEDHFQERAACWVDVTSRLELPDTVSDRLARLDPTEQDRTRQEYELEPAAAEAHRQIDARAARRQQTLSAQVSSVFERERERTRAYYAEQLASLARRRATATADQQAMLDARADATRTEQERRLAEIDEKYQASRRIRPYRLHLMLVPVQRIPVDVRRGDRRYPLVLDWLAPSGVFAGIRCPTCDEHAPLVAGKSALGCVQCMGGSSAIPPQPPPPTPKQPTPAARPDPAPPARVSATPTNAPATLAQAARPSTQRTDEPAHTATQLHKAGEKLAHRWWEMAASGNRRIARMCAPDSPAAAVIRLYGPSGADRAIGLSPDERPQEMSTSIYPSTQEAWHAALGAVDTGAGQYDYMLRWRMERGGALVEEVLPYGHRVGARLPWGLSRAALRLHRKPPEPRIRLDPVAAELWEHAPATQGLPLTLRCLAAWWRLENTDEMLERYPAAATAAALERMVCQRASNRASRYADAALAYGMPEAAVRDAGAFLQRRLKLSTTRWW